METYSGGRLELEVYYFNVKELLPRHNFPGVNILSMVL